MEMPVRFKMYTSIAMNEILESPEKMIALIITIEFYYFDLETSDL